jgi:hypothetical protein
VVTVQEIIDYVQAHADALDFFRLLALGAAAALIELVRRWRVASRRKKPTKVNGDDFRSAVNEAVQNIIQDTLETEKRSRSTESVFPKSLDAEGGQGRPSALLDEVERLRETTLRLSHEVIDLAAGSTRSEPFLRVIEANRRAHDGQSGQSREEKLSPELLEYYDLNSYDDLAVLPRLIISWLDIFKRATATSDRLLRIEAFVVAAMVVKRGDHRLQSDGVIGENAGLFGHADK